MGNRQTKARRRSASEWQREVRRWRRSGLSSREYAERNGINANTLLCWSSKLGAAGAPESEGDHGLRLVEVDVVEDGDTVEVDETPLAGWELRSAAGHVLRVAGPLTQAHVEAVVAAMLEGGREK